jgi:hypothetical protein
VISAGLVERARDADILVVAERLGAKLKGIGADRCGPCPACGGRDRLSINTRKQVWSCRQCSGGGRNGKHAGGNVISLVELVLGVSFREAVAYLAGEGEEITAPRPRSGAPPARTEGEEAYQRRQREKARWLWGRRAPLAGSIAETYLRQARRYGGPLPASLAFLPAFREHPPALIAAFGMPEEPEPGILDAPRDIAAVLLTALKPDGSGKAGEKPKKIIGSPGGLPIAVAPVNDLLGLAITEGIEDALSAHEATGLGAWAAGGAPFLPKLAAAVPAYVECVTIFAHPDPDGLRGARGLERLLIDKGVEVRIDGVG